MNYQPNNSQYATILPEIPTINDGKWTMKSTSACTHTNARYCRSRDGRGVGWTSGGGGVVEVTCLRFPLSHRQPKLKIYKWVNP